MPTYYTLERVAELGFKEQLAEAERQMACSERTSVRLRGCGRRSTSLSGKCISQTMVEAPHRSRIQRTVKLTLELLRLLRHARDKLVAARMGFRRAHHCGNVVQQVRE